MSVIQLENVCRLFGKKKVLDGVTGEIGPGQVVGLLGRNGEGKSTLFKIMLDILAADSGNISVLGYRPDGSAKIRQICGYIPERPAYHEFMTVQAALELRAAFFRNWDWDKAVKMAKHLELDLSSRIRGASKGTLAKTAWICATAHHPQVLVLDEPTSGLDPVVRESVITELVRELAEEGKTMILTNHHMEEFIGVLDAVWILKEGVIQKRHRMEDLRNCSLTITGRLHDSAQPPGTLGILEEQKIGNLVKWSVLNKEAPYEIERLNLLENMQVEPLPLETAFRLLLHEVGND